MLKIITIGILILLLMIPASMLENLVNERQSSRVEEETINFDAQINLNGSKRIDFYLSENH